MDWVTNLTTSLNEWLVWIVMGGTALLLYTLGRLHEQLQELSYNVGLVRNAVDALSDQHIQELRQQVDRILKAVNEISNAVSPPEADSY